MRLQSTLLSNAGFAHGFTLRTGGVSVGPFDSLNLARNVGDDAEAVTENHRRVAAALGYVPGALFEMNQVHGARVREVTTRDLAANVLQEDGDALVTREACAVAVRVADCLPVLLADPVTGAVAAVHVGWRGAVAGVVAAALKVMAPASTANVLAAIGPHIRADVFEVGEDVAEEIRAASPGADPVVRGYAKPHIDLACVVRAQLLALGLAPGHVDDVGGCTVTDSARFFSYRRDAGRTGRQAGIILGRAPLRGTEASS